MYQLWGIKSSIPNQIAALKWLLLKQLPISDISWCTQSVCSARVHVGWKIIVDHLSSWRRFPTIDHAPSWAWQNLPLDTALYQLLLFNAWFATYCWGLMSPFGYPKLICPNSKCNGVARDTCDEDNLGSWIPTWHKMTYKYYTPFN